MAFQQEQLEELKSITPSVKAATEGGYTFLFIERLELPDGCTPYQTDVLLCPTPREGYESRLFFACQISCMAGLNWNGTIRVLDRTWYAYSWRTKSNLRLAEMLIVHLSALRKK